MTSTPTIPTPIWLQFLKGFITYGIPIIAMALSTWTFLDTQKKLRRENAMRVYREVSMLLDSACRIGTDLSISFDRKEPPPARDALWGEFSSLNAQFRDNRTRYEHELGLYFGPALGGKVIDLVDDLLEVSRDYGPRSMAELKEESEASRMYEQSIVQTSENWRGADEEDFSYPDAALRWKLLRVIGGREAQALEKAELRRIEEMWRERNEEQPD